MKINIFGIIMLLLFSCSSGTSPDQENEFTIKYGKTISAGNIYIQFDELAEDSRCAIGVECVWEGNAEVDLRINSGGEWINYSINTTLDPRLIVIEGYQLELVSVSPYPVYADTVAIEDYEIKVALIK